MIQNQLVDQPVLATTATGRPKAATTATVNIVNVSCLRNNRFVNKVLPKPVTRRTNVTSTLFLLPALQTLFLQLLVIQSLTIPLAEGSAIPPKTWKRSWNHVCPMPDNHNVPDTVLDELKKNEEDVKKSLGDWFFSISEKLESLKEDVLTLKNKYVPSRLDAEKVRDLESDSAFEVKNLPDIPSNIVNAFRPNKQQLYRLVNKAFGDLVRISLFLDLARSEETIGKFQTSYLYKDYGIILNNDDHGVFRILCSLEMIIKYLIKKPDDEVEEEIRADSKSISSEPRDNVLRYARDYMILHRLEAMLPVYKKDFEAFQYFVWDDRHKKRKNQFFSWGEDQK